MVKEFPATEPWTLCYAPLNEVEDIRALDRYSEKKVVMRPTELVSPAISLNLVHALYDPAGKLSGCAMAFPVDERMRDLAPAIAAQLDARPHASTLPNIFAYEASHLCASPEARAHLEIGPLMHLVRIQMAVVQGWTEPIIWNVLANNTAQQYVLEKRIGVVRVRNRPKPLEEGLRARIDKYLDKEKTFLPSERWLKKMPRDLDKAVITYAAPAKEARFFPQRLRGVMAAFTSAPASSGRHLRIQGELLRRMLSTKLIDSLSRETDMEIAAPWHKNDLTKA